MSDNPRKSLIGPFVQTMVSAAFLFLLGVLLTGPFAKIVVAINEDGLWGAPLWIWAQLLLYTVIAGVVWTSFWIWFKRGEKKVIEALDERGEYWWLPGGRPKKKDSGQSN